MAYNSMTAKGYKKGSCVTIPLGVPSPIGKLASINVKISIAGKSYSYFYYKDDLLGGVRDHKFCWNGKDNHGRNIYGSQNANIALGYTYKAEYLEPDEFNEFAQNAFGRTGYGATSSTRDLTITLWAYLSYPLIHLNIEQNNLGEWGLTIKHTLIPQLNKIYKAIGDLKDVSVTDKWVIKNFENMTSNYYPQGYMTDNYILQDGEGILYFVKNYAVYKTDKEKNTSVFAGSPNQLGDSGDGGLATNARFGFIHTIALDEMGNLYISDGDNAKIRKVDKITNIITTVAGNGEKTYSGVGNNANYGIFQPMSLASYNNEIYFIDGNGIKKVDSNHILRNVLKGVSVSDIAVDDNGNTYYVTYSSVYKVTPDGETVLLATHSSYTDLRAVAVNIDGSVYFANWYFIKKINTDGTITDIAGDGTSGYAGNNEPAINAKFQRIEDLTFDNEGNLYIADDSNCVIRKIDTNGIITTIAGTGYVGTAVEGGNPLTTSLYFPYKIAVDSNKNIYVVESSTERLFKFKENEIIQIINRRGYSNIGYSGDNGSVFDAKFSSSITGLETDSLNNLYISDAGNKVIRKVDTNNIVTTFAGMNDSNYYSSSENHYRGDGLQAKQAAVEPLTMAIGKDGTIYFADFSNANITIRKIYSDGYVERMILKDESGNEVKLNNYSEFIIKNNKLYFTSGSESSCKAIYKVDLTTNIIIKLAGTTTQYCGVNNWPIEYNNALDENITPSQLMVDEKENVYFYDNQSSRILMITDANTLKVIAGGCGFRTREEWDNLGREVCSPIMINTEREIIQNFGSSALSYVMEPGYFTIGSDKNIWMYLSSCSNIFYLEVNKTDTEITSYSRYSVLSEDGSLKYEFDPYGRHLKTVDTILNKTLLEFKYDNSGILTKIIDENGGETNFVRAEGENVTIISPYGEETKLTIQDGLLTEVKYKDETSYTMTYKTGNEGQRTELLESFTNPRGNASIFEYNSDGILQLDTNAAGGSKSLVITESERKATTVIATGMNRATKYEIKQDTSGNIEYKNTSSDGRCIISQLKEDGSGTITQPDGTTVEMSQTADPRFGWQIPYTNKIKTTLPSGKSVTIETQKTAELLENDIFKPSKLKNQTTINGSRTVTKEIDVVNKTIKTKSPMGKEGISYFNEKGQIVQSEISGMLPVNYMYDTKGRVTKVSQGDRFTSMRYNEKGYLSEVENVDGDVVEYFYDEMGQLERTVLPNSEEINQSYDANGNVTDIILPQTEENISRNHSYEYTAIDQVDYYETPVTYGISYRTDYDYNLDGQLTTVTEPTNNVINYNYDATSGVLQSIVHPHDTLTYSYNAESKNLERIQTANGDSLVYDYDGSLLKTEANTGTLGDYIEWKYNEFLMVNEIIAKGQSTLYGYNNDGELTSAGLSVYERNTLNGRIEKITIGETDEYYTYNNYGEIEKKEVKYQNNLIYSESYVYNNKGFIEAKTVVDGNVTDIYNYTYDNLGRLTEVIKNDATVEIYSFDSNGNRISESFFTEYDNQDRMIRYKDNLYDYTQRGSLREKTTSNGTTLYNYDVIGNLRGVTLEDGTVIDYVIDGRNRRIAKKVNGVVVQKFLYLNQLEPIAELDGDNNLVSLFVYGSKGNVPEYIIKSGVAYKVITNQLGSVVKVINAYGGMVQQEIEYDSFGNILSDSNPTFQPFRLAGGLYDVDTKLIRFGARDYDSETGRWTSKDPIKFDGGRNFYVYAFNNPIMLIDVNGKKPGDLFDTPEQAASDVLSASSCIGINQEFEYGGWIVKEGDKYYATEPYTSGKSKELEFYESIDNTVGYYHSHVVSGIAGENFSVQDVIFAELLGIDGYLLNTIGFIGKYDNFSDIGNYVGDINWLEQIDISTICQMSGNFSSFYNENYLYEINSLTVTKKDDENYFFNFK